MRHREAKPCQEFAVVSYDVAIVQHVGFERGVCHQITEGGPHAPSLSGYRKIEAAGNQLLVQILHAGPVGPENLGPPAQRFKLFFRLLVIRHLGRNPKYDNDMLDIIGVA